MNTSGGSRPGADRVRRAGAASLALNIPLTVLKGAVGILAGSRALTADAVHSLTDLSTDLSIVVGSLYWGKPPDEEHPMGHGGIETGVTLFIGIMLASAGIGIGLDSLRAVSGYAGSSSPGIPAVVAAGVSVISKGLLSRWMFRVGRETGSQALIANARHNRSDALSSLPVLLAVGVSTMVPGLAFIDGAAGMVVSVFIVMSSWKVLEPVFKQLVNASPSEELLSRIRTAILEEEGVTGFHRLRARMQAGGIFVDLHLQVEGRVMIEEAFLTARRVENAVRALDPSIIDVMVRVEPWAPCGDADRCFHRD